MIYSLKQLACLILACMGFAAAFSQNNITRLEYYVDKDPGYGKAFPANFTPASSVNTSFDVRVDTLSPGLHIIGMRSKDAGGQWSFDERWLVLKHETTSGIKNISRVEYYVDKDPGYSKAYPATITFASNVNTSFDVRMDTLLPGLHIIGVRSKDAGEKWSFDERWLVLKQDTIAALKNIDRVEWFVDKDPGYGKAKNAVITPGLNIATSFDVVADTLSPGLHIIGVRSKDAGGKWSFDERWLVLKQDTTPAPANIELVEWYVDTDPGYGKATSIDLSPATDLSGLFLNYNIGSLAPGLHIIGIRSRDARKTWSMDERWLLLKQPPIIKTPNLKRIEYYIDTDPGWGKGIPLAFFPAKDVVAPPAFVNVTGLVAGTHKLFIRSQDDNNAWSFDDTLHFNLASLKTAPYINVNSVAFTNVCAAGSFTMGYHATGNFNPGNEFKAELSDAQGSFAQAQIIGSLTSVGNGGIITCDMPPGITQGTGFKMRVRSTNPPLTSDGSDQSLSISVSTAFLGRDTFKVVACAEERVDLTQYYNPANSILTWTVGNPAAAPLGIHSVYAINSLGCKDTASISISLPTAIWSGSIDKDWHKPGNWNTGKLPADTTHVIIPAGTPYSCEIINADAVAASVHVRVGAASLKITNGHNLLIKAVCKTVPQ